MPSVSLALCWSGLGRLGGGTRPPLQNQNRAQFSLLLGCGATKMQLIYTSFATPRTNLARKSRTLCEKGPTRKVRQNCTKLHILASAANQPQVPDPTPKRPKTVAKRATPLRATLRAPNLHWHQQSCPNSRVSPKPEYHHDLFPHSRIVPTN